MPFRRATLRYEFDYSRFLRRAALFSPMSSYQMLLLLPPMSCRYADIVMNTEARINKGIIQCRHLRLPLILLPPCL